LKTSRGTKLIGLTLAILLTLATAAGAAPGITDSFTRPDGPIGVTETGQSWLPSGSTWVVQSNRARVTTTTSYGYATVPIASSSTFVVEADIGLSPTYRRANAGLTVLWRSASNHIFCKIEVTQGRPTGLMSIGRKLNNVVTSLLAFRAGTGFRNGQTYHVSCSRAGNRLTMTVSGGNLRAPISVAYTLTSSDLAAFGTANRAGLRSRYFWDEDDGLSTWDNFRVTA
jgi:hypothetical protein